MGGIHSPRAGRSAQELENELGTEYRFPMLGDLALSGLGGYGNIQRRPVPEMQVLRPTPSPGASDVSPEAHVLIGDLVAVSPENSKFAAFSRNRVTEAACMVIKSDIAPIEDFRTADEEGRRYLLGDLGGGIGLLSKKWHLCVSFLAI